MAIPYPKILTRVTVPTGGYAFKFYVSDSAQFDTLVTATVPAGDYFVSGDNQADDFLYALCNAATTQLRLVGGWAATGNVFASVDTSYNIVIQFGTVFTTTHQDVRVDWPNSTGVAAVLGFSTAATDDLTGGDNPSTTSDWVHAVGWFADEDGYLANLPNEDANEVFALQSRALSGVVRSQQLGVMFTSELSLQFLTKAKTFTRNIGYAGTNVYPYEKNVGLESWWREARQGTEFRVYRDGRKLATIAADRGTSTASTTTTLTIGSKTWDTDPQRWAGAILRVPTFTSALDQCYYISSNTATVLTASQATYHGLQLDGAGGSVAVELYDHRYQTYVVDLERMTSFAPEEIPQIDRYNITIPLRRYIA